MPENSSKWQLNEAKRKACSILRSAGYKVEKSQNQTFCLTAMRDAEWRVIAIGMRNIIKCPWFLTQIKNLERLPTPDPKTIKKEIWIKEPGEQNFYLYHWFDGKWVDENLEQATCFK